MKSLEKRRFMIFMGITLFPFCLGMINWKFVFTFILDHGYLFLVAFVAICLLGIFVSPFTSKLR
jgi:hypothetical protein